MTKMLVFLYVVIISLLAGCIRPEPPDALTPPVANTARCTPMNLRECLPSPDGQWTAEINSEKGTLLHNAATGAVQELFPADNSSSKLTWSPDSQRLVIVRNNWHIDSAGQLQENAPPQIWQSQRNGDAFTAPTLLFEKPKVMPVYGEMGPGEIKLGDWSPDNRQLLFWVGPISGSIEADGLPLYGLNTATGQTTLLADSALLNPRYHSWSPDGSALAYTAGGYRSAQVNKWLNLWDSKTSQLTTVISSTEQIPGIVAWSPTGEWIAYAAVPASATGAEWADLMTVDNPAIAGRRLYLLNPTTGETQRLNTVDALQDAPVWSGDGVTLYYVQRDGNEIVLMAADPATGAATPIEAARRPLPDAIGYYGQGEWDDVLAHLPGKE
ncbi:MAG: hypothetical protein R3E79_28595 [Caldilineaceae bacterium]